jgi:hypothetical protein
VSTAPGLGPGGTAERLLDGARRGRLQGRALRATGDLPPTTYPLGWSDLVRLKHSLQAPRPRHTQADAAQQTACKQN